MVRKFLLLALMGVALATNGLASTAEAKTYRIGYNIYVGFVPLQWMADHGVLDKWAKKYGVDIKVVQVNDLVAGQNQFVNNDLDGFASNFMDALTIPAAGGVDTTIALAGDYSNGNDAIVTKSAKSVADLKGQTIDLFEFTVSHYILSRALEQNGLSLRDVKTTNVSDADIASAWIGSKDVQHAVSWNPMLQSMAAGVKGTKTLFSSANIPEEIVDVVIFHTSTVKHDPNFMKAFTGAWYETMSLMKGGGDKGKAITADLAALSGGSVPEFQAQMDATHMYYNPQEAYDLLTSNRQKKTWDFIRTFAFNVGLFGHGATNKDFVGIQLPDGTVLGNADKIKLRVDPRYIKMAADGKL